MSHRLQVLIPEALDQRIQKAAKRQRISKGEWVRQAIAQALSSRDAAANETSADLVSQLASLEAPTADPDDMLAQIEAGRK